MMLLFTFVWMPVGIELSNQVAPAFSVCPSCPDPSLLFMVLWGAIGMAIIMLVAWRYEVWID
jgi:hypothetical protein